MKKYWLAFTAVIVISFTVLGWIGVRIYQQAPPIPEKVITTTGETVFTREDIERGQNVWQAMGGMEVGSIWGHGSYVAPDWSADWLHREAIFVLDVWAKQQYGIQYLNLKDEEKASLKSKLQKTFRTNTFDQSSGVITIIPERGVAVAENAKHYSEIFTN